MGWNETYLVGRLGLTIENQHTEGPPQGPFFVCMTERDDYRDVGGTSPRRNEVESQLERRQTQGFDQGSSYVAEPKDGRERLSCRNRAGYSFERGTTRAAHSPCGPAFGRSLASLMLESNPAYLISRVRIPLSPPSIKKGACKPLF